MTTRNQQMVPDWGQLIDDLLSDGVTQREIAKAMGVDVNDRMLRHYRAGVQPIFHRGTAIVDLWCRTRGKTAADIVMVPFVRGHRVPNNREVSQAPRLAGDLPSFPPITAKPAVKRGRKAKEAA